MPPKGKKRIGDGSRGRNSRLNTRKTSSTDSPCSEEKIEHVSDLPDVVTTTSSAIDVVTTSSSAIDVVNIVNIDTDASSLSAIDPTLESPPVKCEEIPEEIVDVNSVQSNVSVHDLDSSIQSNKGFQPESSPLPILEPVVTSDDMNVDGIPDDVPGEGKSIPNSGDDSMLLRDGVEENVTLCSNEPEDEIKEEKVSVKRNVRIVKRIVKKKVLRKVSKEVSDVSNKGISISPNSNVDEQVVERDTNTESSEKSTCDNVYNTVLEENICNPRMNDAGRIETSEVQLLQSCEARVNVTNTDKVEEKDNDILGIQKPDCSETLKNVVVSCGGEDVAMGDDENCNREAESSREIEVSERKEAIKTEIYIGGLDKNVKEEDIRNIFEEDGNIDEVRMKMNKRTGKNKGYAFIKFTSASDAKKALDKHPNIKVCGKECRISAVEVNDTIYLGNIDKNWKSEDIIKLLENIGIAKIFNVTVLTDRINPEYNRGFAFLEFETSKDAHDSFKKLQIENAFGSDMSIKVAWAESQSVPDNEERLSVKSVYAKFLPPSWDEEKIMKVFKKFGEVESISPARNLILSKRKDFAFVNFTTHDSAISCVESFDNEVLSDNDSKVPIKVAIARPEKGKKHKPVSKTTTKKKSKDKSKPSNSRPGSKYYQHFSGRKRPLSLLDNDYLVSNPQNYRRTIMDDPYSRISHGVSMPSLPVYMTGTPRPPPLARYEYPSYPTRYHQGELYDRDISGDMYYRY